MGSIPLFDLFLILFVGMGPVKALLIFIDLTQGVDPDLQRKVVRKMATTAVAVASCFWLREWCLCVCFTSALAH